MVTKDDLLKEISQKELQELSDINNTGEIDNTIIDDCINDALSYISSFIILPTNPTPLLKNIAVDLTIIELKKRNDLLNEAIKDTQKKCDDMLLKMSNKKLPTSIDSNQNITPTTKTRAFCHNNKKLDLRR